MPGRQVHIRRKRTRSRLMTTTHYLTANVDGLKISYRQAGRTEAPTVLLLHGFPSTGHMFRELISLLADRYHLVAPDLPGFGQSDLPARAEFHYTFNNLAQVMDRFTDLIGLTRFAMYVFDYGANRVRPMRSVKRSKIGRAHV